MVNYPPPFTLCKESLFASEQPRRAPSLAGFFTFFFRTWVSAAMPVLPLLLPVRALSSFFLADVRSSKSARPPPLGSTGRGKPAPPRSNCTTAHAFLATSCWIPCTVTSRWSFAIGMRVDRSTLPISLSFPGGHGSCNHGGTYFSMRAANRIGAAGVACSRVPTTNVRPLPHSRKDGGYCTFGMARLRLRQIPGECFHLHAASR
jgi:hypothetical protein